jgi:hypothetical protein
MIKEPPLNVGDVVYVENWFPELKEKVGR